MENLFLAHNIYHKNNVIQFLIIKLNNYDCKKQKPSQVGHFARGLVAQKGCSRRNYKHPILYK